MRFFESYEGDLMEKVKNVMNYLRKFLKVFGVKFLQTSNGWKSHNRIIHWFYLFSSLSSLSRLTKQYIRHTLLSIWRNELKRRDFFLNSISK